VADVHSPAIRSFNMSKIGGKDTAPEMALRSALHRAGRRFRVHRPDLPGRPDIVLPGVRVAVFVNGCFWHRHAECRYSTTPKSNESFWARKFARTVERDRDNMTGLARLGWRVFVAWECDIRRSASAVADDIERFINSDPGTSST
jgi:DNA mismatch endonuclease, patch repair protein